MRIPLHKTYRAFPEFDRFSDARCEAYMRYVERRHVTRLWAVGVAVWVGAVLAALISMPFAIAIMYWVIRVLVGSSVRGANEWWFMPAMGGGLALSMGIWSLAALLIRDAHLRRIMGRQLKGVTCGLCSYSLLGAVVVAGRVRCPECGEAFLIESRGLREEDFRVGTDDLPGVEALPVGTTPAPPPDLDPVEKERLLSRVRTRREGEDNARAAALLTKTSCVSCGYALRGLSPTDGFICCPECGAPNPVIDSAQKERLIDTVARTREGIDDRSAPPVPPTP